MVEILDAATQLFRERGFQGTTTQELADAVGLVKGTLYYHIGSKDELLYRIHEQVTNEGLARWKAIVEANQDAPAPRILRKMIVEHCLVIDQYRDWVAVFSEEMKHLPAEFHDRVRAKRAEYQKIFEDVVRHGVERGELATDDPHLTALVALGMLNAMYRWYSPKGRLTPGRIGGIMASIFLDGIRPAVGD
jgi:AcrR family transcriptional regulator